MTYNAQIVSNKHVRKSHLVLQVSQQIQDLRLNGHIQGRHWLIAYNELWVHRQSSCNTDTLAAAAIKLMGIGVEESGLQSDRLHQFKYPFLALGLVCDDAIDQQGFSDDLAHTVAEGSSWSMDPEK